jgi:hypothetical protein
VQLPRSSYQYKKNPKDDSIIQEALTHMVDKRPSIGFWQSIHGAYNITNSFLLTCKYRSVVLMSKWASV